MIEIIAIVFCLDAPPTLCRRLSAEMRNKEQAPFVHSLTANPLVRSLVLIRPLARLQSASSFISPSEKTNLNFLKTTSRKVLGVVMLIIVLVPPSGWGGNGVALVIRSRPNRFPIMLLQWSVERNCRGYWIYSEPKHWRYPGLLAPCVHAHWLETFFSTFIRKSTLKDVQTRMDNGAKNPSFRSFPRNVINTATQLFPFSEVMTRHVQRAWLGYVLNTFCSCPASTKAWRASNSQHPCRVGRIWHNWLSVSSTPQGSERCGSYGFQCWIKQRDRRRKKHVGQFKTSMLVLGRTLGKIREA